MTDDVEESDLLFNYKPNSTYIKPEKLNNILQSDSFPPLLVSEYMPGAEYTIDCLIVEGVIKFIIPRLRKTMNNGISGAGLNMAAIAVQPNMVSDIKNINDYPIRWGTKFIRHYTELYY